MILQHSSLAHSLISGMIGISTIGPSQPLVWTYRKGQRYCGLLRLKYVSKALIVEDLLLVEVN